MPDLFPTGKKPTIGERVIDMIIRQGMIRVSHCPGQPSEGHVFTWSANAAEQITALFHEYAAWEEPCDG